MRYLPEIPAGVVPKASLWRRFSNRMQRMFSNKEHIAHFIYFVPSDKLDRASTAIEDAAKNLQRWYKWQTGGQTFSFNSPIVQTAATQQPAAWYSTHDPGGDFAGWFWINVLNELAAQFGGGFYQEFDDWMVYIDAEPAPGQYAGGTSGGAYSGVCVLGQRDLNALLGQDPEWTHCREVGGLGHEGGHSFGLPHPEGYPDWGLWIMGTGYSTYPNCALTPEDKTWLAGNPFFKPGVKIYPFGLECQFNDSVRPVPKPRPKPKPPHRP